MTWRDDAIRAFQDAQAEWWTSDSDQSCDAYGVDAALAVLLREVRQRPCAFHSVEFLEFRNREKQARRDAQARKDGAKS